MVRRIVILFIFVAGAFSIPAFGQEKPVQKLEEALKNISSTEPNPTDSEKVKSEKLMVSLQRKIEELEKKGKKEEKNIYSADADTAQKMNIWLIDYTPDIMTGLFFGSARDADGNTINISNGSFMVQVK